MYLRILFGMSAAGLLAILISPAGYGQFKLGNPQQGGGAPGGQKNFGGGAPTRGGYMNDPNKAFDFMARGQPVLVIADMPFKGLQGPLLQFAQEKGISNGQITREQFVEFSESMKAKMASAPKAPGDATPATPAAGTSLESLQQLADADFKNHDENGDGKLNPDEMPPPLRRDLARWDANKDGFIDQDEYRAYYISRMQERMARANANTQGAQQPAPSALDALIDVELEKRPVVFRAGKLPEKGLPAWFRQLDTDADGQVALYEWRLRRPRPGGVQGMGPRQRRIHHA